MNPFFNCYASTTGLDEYAKPSAICVTGRGNRYDQAFQDARAARAIVAQYWMTFECPDNLSAPLDQEIYYVDGKPPPLWPYRDANNKPRVNFPNTHLLDIRPSSPYFGQIKKYARAQIESRKFDGFMLDGMGCRLWSALAAWDTWPQAERDVWTASMIAIAKAIHEIRVELWPEFEIYHNNVWSNAEAAGSEIGMTYANGCVGENWKFDSWHRTYVTKPFAGEPFKRRVIIISPTPALADQWKADSNVTHITLIDKSQGQSYRAPTPPIVPYEDENPPPPDPCADCKQTVAELTAENADLNVELAKAKVSLATSQAEVGKLSGKIKKIDAEIHAP